MPHYGSVASKDPRAAQQAASIGATIAPNGWWMKDGQHLSPEEADALTREAGSAIQANEGGVDGIAHGGWAGNAVERNRDFTGNLMKNIAPLTALIPGIGPFAAAALAGASGAVGQGIRHGSNFGDILKQGAGSAAMASGISGGLNAAGGAAANGGGWGSQLAAGAKGAVSGYGSGTSNALKGVGQLPGVGALTQSLGNAPGVKDIISRGNDIASWGKNALGGLAPEGSNMSNIGDWAKQALGGLVPRNLDGSINLDKIGAMASGGIDAYNKNRTTNSNIDYQNKSIQLARDGQQMNDQQFAAKYGMDKSAAQAQVDEYNKNFGLTSAQVASAAQSRLNSAPLRDQSNYLMQRLMSSTPGAFKPSSIFTGGADALGQSATGGAADAIGQSNTARASYTPGAGGTNNSVDQGIVGRYANATPVTYHDPGSYTGSTAKRTGGYTTGSSGSAFPSATPDVSAPTLPTGVKSADAPPTGGAPLVPTASAPVSTPAAPATDDPVLQARKLLMARLGGGAGSSVGGGAGAPPSYT